jgi:hypothetical protein
MREQISATEVTELIDVYCAAWSDPDPARRAALLRQVWGEGATYTDPTVHAATADELLVHIDKVVARRPEARVVRTSAIDMHHGIARFAWHVVQADGTTLPDGLDIVELSPDGTQIRRIVGFFRPLRAI